MKKTGESSMSSSWQQSVSEHWQQLESQSQSMWSALEQRLQPLIDQLEPIWSDPLWQFVGLVVGLLLLTFLVYKIGQVLWDSLLSVASLISSVIGKPFAWLDKKLQQRQQRKQQQQQQQKTRWRWLSRVHVRQGIDVVRYLTTRRDWRYRTQWHLLTGLDGSGKSQWVDSIAHNTRTHLLAREKQLISDGSQWRFFDQGTIIEVEQEKDFPHIVDLLNFYRPERPVDGIILTVSAQQLVAASEPTEQRQLGERLYQQLWQIQQKTGFVVPVYVQLTQCDLVPGFEAFWRARNKDQPKEMFGWSNPYRMDEAYSDQWIDEAFDTLVDGVRSGQLAVAAKGGDIEDIDAFMLFDRELMQLYAPLKAVLSYAFSRSSFQDAPPLRGIWLSGLINGQAAPTEDFFSQKLWPEANLAYPLEQRRFSANRILRRMQYASLAMLVFFCMALAFDSHRLYRYSSDTEGWWQEITNRKDDYCDAGGERTWWLLTALTRMSQQPNTLAIPASWGNGQLDTLQQAVAQRVLPERLFKGMECRLRQRADELRKNHFKPLSSNADLKQANARLTGFINDLSDYQKAQQLFIELAAPTSDGSHIDDDLSHLLRYLYDTAIPSTIRFDSPLIAGAVERGSYDHRIRQADMLEPDRQLSQLYHLSSTLHEQLIMTTLSPPVSRLQRAFMALSDSSYQREDNDMEAALQEFEQWVEYVQHYWLISGSSNSPCGQTFARLQTLQRQLLDAGYPSAPLAASVHHFKTEQCDQFIRTRLARMNIAPLGDMFVLGEADKLVLTPVLKHWVDQFAALESLPFIANPVDTSIESITAGQEAKRIVVGWQRDSLIQAMDAILAYQAFKHQWWQQSAPFYATAVNQHLRLSIASLIDQAQIFKVVNSTALLDANDEESQLAASVSSFQAVSASIKQLMALLKQEGDEANLALLKNASQRFARQQLSQLDQLVKDNRIYLPLPAPQWASENFAAALFSYPSEAEMDSYLQNQRQRLSYVATLYAKPMVTFLVDTQGVSSTDTSANRWLDTLRDMRRYDRQEPGNHVLALEQFAGSTLVQLNAADCNQWLKQPAAAHRSGGLFATRHYRIEKQVRSYCQQYGKNTVIKRYLALAERFNRELAGFFPFASLEQAGRQDISPEVLTSFLEDYRHQWGQPVQGKTLLQGLEELVAAQPQLALDGWLEFVRQLDQLAGLWQQSQDGKGMPRFNLDIEFAALPQQSLGVRQIVQWTLNSGSELLTFPNGQQQTNWVPGDDLQLTLRWASGSEFRPAHNSEHPVQVNDKQRTAIFNSRGRWALFEWWRRYAQRDHVGQSTQLMFEVPVVGHGKDSQAAPTSYLSKVNLLVDVSAIHDGQANSVSLPIQLPVTAPGIPGDLSQPGGKSLATSEQP